MLISENYFGKLINVINNGLLKWDQQNIMNYIFRFILIYSYNNKIIMICIL